MTPVAANADGYETEWQFDAADLDRAAEWLAKQPPSAALTFGLKKEVVQRDVYLDTEDWALYRAGFGLRIRQAQDEAEATLKSLAAGEANSPRVRREINQSLLPGATDLLSLQGPVSDRVKLLAGKHGLRQLFEIATHRRAYRASAGSGLVAEIALDDTRILVDSAVSDYQLKRVEIERLGPPQQDALISSFVSAMAGELRLQPAALSKFEAGLRAAGLTPQASHYLGPTVAAADAGATEFALATLRRFFEALIAHEPGTRLGEDIEELHQMRVTVRRLRAALSMFAQVLPTGLMEMDEELRWLGRALGDVRDLDVQIEDFAKLREGASWEESNAIGELTRVLRASLLEARSRLIDVLDSERYQQILARLRAELATQQDADQSLPVRDFVEPVLRKRYRRFKKAAAALDPDSEATAYHNVRVRGKRLRYCVEFARPIYDKPARRLADAMTTVQDILGEHQDATVSIDRLRGLARERGADFSSQTLVYMGELIARHRARMQDLRGHWPKAFALARRRWRRLRAAMDATSVPDHGEPLNEAQSEPNERPVRRWRGGPFALLRRRGHPAN